MKNDGKADTCREESVIRPLLRIIYPYGGVMTAVCWLVMVLSGFDWRDLTGCVIGYGYMCLCYEYLGRTCERAVRCERKRAERMMRSCYFLRFGGLMALCLLGEQTRTANFIGIILPQFFPRMILTYAQFCGERKKGRR